MRNRVNFCRALLKDVQILYLDEPTSGLDPATTEKIHELILEERKKGTAVFLTTHNMYEAHVARLIQEEQITSIHSSEPTLEQVFLHLTGRSLL